MSVHFNVTFVSILFVTACGSPPASRTAAEISAASEQEFATMPEGGAFFPIPNTVDVRVYRGPDDKVGTPCPPIGSPPDADCSVVIERQQASPASSAPAP